MLKKIALALAAAGAIAIPAGLAIAHSGPDGGERGAKFKAHHAEMLQKYDADHDGKLSPDERAKMIHEKAAERFTALDVNHDGLLSPAEFEEGMKQMHERFGGPGRHHRGAGGPDQPEAK